jgi:hypothetical protein
MNPCLNLLAWQYSWLLTMQSVVAFSSGGDVDGRASVRGGSVLDLHGGDLGAMLGLWRVDRWQGLDEFMEGLGFPKWKRALASRVGQEQLLQLKGGQSGNDATLRIVTSDLRGKSE